MNRKAIICLAAVLSAATFSACNTGGAGSSAQAAAITEVSIRETVEVADPQAAAETIYASLEDRRVEELDAEGLQNLLNIDPKETEEFLVYLSDANAGLCDLAILRPDEESRDDLREALLSYKDRRIEEFKNFDILGSYDIAQNALVYDQGDYLILLMLPDNEAAQEVVDQYIPQ